MLLFLRAIISETMPTRPWKSRCIVAERQKCGIESDAGGAPVGLIVVLCISIMATKAQMYLKLSLWLCLVGGGLTDGSPWNEFEADISARRLGRETDPTLRDCSDPENIYLPSSVTETTDRLIALSQQMKAEGFDAYIVPTEDEHLSEFVAPRYERRAWISGFTGLSGVAVVTATEALLWTDVRAYLQAQKEMDCNWTIMKSGAPDTPSISDWILSSNSSTVGANPFVFSITLWNSYESALKAGGINFTRAIPDIIDTVWVDRPESLGTEIIVFSLKYAGKPWNEKVSDVRLKMVDKGADYLLLTKLDEIAWLFNLRGNDIPIAPLFTSYALVGMSEVRLYINMSLQTEDLTNHLSFTGCDSQKMCVDLREYGTAYDDILNMPTDNRVWMSTASTTYGMYSAVDAERQIKDESPVKIPMSIKNEVEQEGMKQAQIWDAIAVCEYIIWLEENVPKGTVDEISGADYLESLRWAQAANKGQSFPTTTSSGPNSAVIHYQPTNETKRQLSEDELYLLDSGGLYYEGTTDTTRAFHFGTPTDFQKEIFTRVLMGIIDVATSVFPSTLDGNNIDILARGYLYEIGLNYKHSTGHGVGQYLTLHEYPPGIGTTRGEGYAIQAGMVTSIEPAYYEDGEFGIRLENMFVVVEADTKHHFGEHSYLTFEAITMVPFQQKMIDISLLSDKQLEYLNAYHAKVMQTIGEEALLQGKKEVREWLKTATKPITRNAGSTPRFMSWLGLCMIITSLATVKSI